MNKFGTVLGAAQGVRVNRLEKRLNPLVPFPYRHDFYHLVLVTEGKGWHEVDFHRYPIHASQLFFMKPGQVHSWRIDAKSSGLPLRYMGEIPDELDLASPSTNLRSSLRELLKLMLNEYERQQPGFDPALQYYLALLLMELPRTVKGKTEPVQAATILYV